MELQLREQEESANTVIAKWQESCNALEEKNAELLSGLESFGPGEGHREALVEVQQRLQDTEGALAKARDSLRNDDDVVLRWQGKYPLRFLHTCSCVGTRQLISCYFRFAALKRE